MFANLYCDYTILSINNSLEMISGEDHSTYFKQKEKLYEKYPGITISTFDESIIPYQDGVTITDDISPELLTLLNSSDKFKVYIDYCFDLRPLILTLKENRTITSFNLEVKSFLVPFIHFLLPLLDDLFTDCCNITSFKFSGYVGSNIPNVYDYLGTKSNLRKLTWATRYVSDLQIPPNLTSLNLFYLSEEQFVQLLTLLKSNNKITSLSFNNCYIQANTVNLLLDFFKTNTTIKKLKICGCYFINLTPFHLLLDSSNLSSLYIENNNFTINNFNIEAALENCTLNRLVYRSHQVDFPYTCFFNGVKHNKFLTKLELINKIEDWEQANIYLLIELIRTNKTLTSLHFSNIESTPELLTALESNFILQDVKGIEGAEYLYTQEALQQRYNRTFLTKNARSVKYN